MLIKALCDYAEKQADSGIPEGWQEQEIHYRILLTPEGEIKDIVDVREPVEVPAKGGKMKTDLKSRKILVPYREDTSSVSPFFIDTRPLYIWGLDYDKKAKRLTLANQKPKDHLKHPALVEHELSFFWDLNSDICNAYRLFLEKWEPHEMIEHPKLKDLGADISNKHFGFALNIGDGSNLEDDEQFQNKYNLYWKGLNTDKSGSAHLSICGIYGKLLPIAEKHSKIKGILGGQQSGCVMVSMNEESNNSYCKVRSYNSNISEEAMKMYTDALKRLLSDRSHYKVLGDMTVLYFAISSDDSAECDFFSELFVDSIQDSANAEQENYDLDRLMQEVQQGKLNALPEHGFDPDVTFYIVGVTPNATRLCQKFLVRDQFGAVIRNLAQFQQDLRIDESTRQVSFWQIEKQLISPKSTNDKVPPPLMTALMLAAINGTRYPDGLLATVIRRVKTDNDEEKNHFIKLNDIRAGIIKACLNRKAKKEEIKLAWDENNRNPAYLCGGLFAVYEKIQQDASGINLNCTIKDAYFASACSRPASVMPKLAMLSQNHLKKLSEGSNVYYQRMIGHLMEGLAAAFPSTLSLDDQGRFIVGYYHMNRRLWTAAEKKEDTKNV